VLQGAEETAESLPRLNANLTFVQFATGDWGYRTLVIRKSDVVKKLEATC